MSDLPLPESFSDPRRARLHEQLSRLGRVPAALYRDASRLFDGVLTADAAYRLAGHLERELLGSVQDVLLPFDYSRPEASDNVAVVAAIVKAAGGPPDVDTAKLRKLLDRTFKPKQGGSESALSAILRSMGIPQDDDIVTLWKELGLHAVAHRSYLDELPGLDDIRDQWARFERLLSLLLDHFDANYSAAYAKTNAILAKDTPGKDDLSLFRRGVPQNYATLEYFFERIQGRKWFEVLAKSDIFVVPPRGGGWVALGYLRRVTPDYPEEVLSLVLGIEKTENEFVLMGMLDVAKALPADAAIQIFDRVLAAVLRIDRPDSFVARDLTESLTPLAKTHPTAVLRILAALLELRPASTESDGGYLGSKDLIGHVDSHEYGDIVEGPLQAVIDADPNAALSTLSEILDAALRGEYGEPGEDYSSSWMSAVEPHEQNHYFEPLPHLLDAVRRAAEGACTADPTQLPTIVASLVDRGWTIFRRLAVHVLRRCAEPGSVIVRDHLLSPEALHAGDSRHEEHLLFAKAFPHLDAAAQKAIVDAISAGPDLSNQTFDEDAERGAFARRWKLRRFSWIANALPPAEKAAYEGLLGDESPPDETSDFDFYTTAMWVGPESPMTQEQLSEMSLNELVDYLRNWVPSGGMMMATREGIARFLSPLVEKRAAEFAAAAEQFVGLDATYVRPIFSGLTGAVKNGTEIPWEAALKLAVWAVSEPREIPRRDRRGLDDDPHWGWTRSHIAKLLSEGFIDRAGRIPRSLRDEVWNVLKVITEDPDPEPEREGNHDPFTAAINSTRGVAFEAVVGYASWVREGVKPAEVGRADFHDLPEVEAVLTRHLDPAVEPSAAVRAVYGRRLFWLHRLAPEWVRDHLNDLFPPGALPLADAVWQTSLMYGQYTSTAIQKDLSAQYDRAVDSIGALSPYRDYPHRLAGQLVASYLHGHSGIEDGSLLDRFFRNADAQTRTHALGLVPQLMKEAELAELPGMKSRAVAFWEWRTASATDDVELRGFGMWMASEYLDPEWRLHQLLVAVRRAGVPVHDFAVIEVLPALASTHASLVLKCLDELVQKGGTYHELYRITYRGEVEAILRETLASDDPNVQSAARSLANMLISRGFTKLLALLDDEGASK